MIPTTVGQMSSLGEFTLHVLVHSFFVTCILCYTPFVSFTPVDLRLQDNNLGGDIPSEFREMTNLSKSMHGLSCLLEANCSLISWCSTHYIDSLWLYDNVFGGSFRCPDFIDLCYVRCDDFGVERCRDW